MNKKKNILVVGAGGFIAGHLIKRLLLNGNNIMAVTTNLKNIFTSHIIKLFHTLLLVDAFR